MSEQILDRPTAPGGPGPGTSGGSGKGGGGNRTFVIVALAIVGGLILGGLILVVFQPFSTAEVATGPVPRSAAAVAAAKAAAAKAAEDAAAAEEQAATTTTKTTLTSRDPFAPLVPKKQAAAEKPGPAPAASGSAASGSGSASSGSGTSTGKGATISALKISPLGNSVTLKLDGKKYTIDEGETFAKSYRLYDIFNADCAGFLYGDQNAVVCQGDSVQIG